MWLVYFIKPSEIDLKFTGNNDTFQSQGNSELGFFSEKLKELLVSRVFQILCIWSSI